MIDKDAQFQAWLGLDVLYTGMSLRVYLGYLKSIGLTKNQFIFTNLAAAKGQ